MAWGILGDHLGRRRALISALSVAALFSAVASVMPTYGTFMTARYVLDYISNKIQFLSIMFNLYVRIFY